MLPRLRALCAVALVGTKLCVSPLEQPNEPRDAASAHKIARTLAQHARCADVEEYEAKAPKYWEYTCQIADRMVLLLVSHDAALLRERAEVLSASGKSYVSGRFHLAWEFESPDHPTDANLLSRFGGDSNTSKPAPKTIRKK